MRQRLDDDDRPAPPTVRQTLLSGHGVVAVCRACDRIEQLDLLALISAEGGAVQLIELRLRCSCGSRAVAISVQAGKSYHRTSEMP